MSKETRIEAVTDVLGRLARGDQAEKFAKAQRATAIDKLEIEVNAVMDQISLLRAQARRGEELEAALDSLTRGLARLATLDLEELLPRTNSGDAVDVVAFLLNTTMEEMGTLLTEIDAAKKSVAQAEKMQAIGRLAGGIAHDFNNLLATIILTATCALREIAPGSQARQDVADILEAAQRGTALTNRLLVFARRHVLNPGISDLSAVLLDQQTTLRRLVDDTVKLKFEMAPELWYVRIDDLLIEQVLVNLVTNSGEAMAEEGTIRIALSNCTMHAQDLRGRPDVAPGQYVLVTVDDTGVGMTEEVREKAFEPFFTTKGHSSGAGLGLSLCYSVANQAEGHIRLVSRREGGLSVEILIPRAEGRLTPKPSLTVGSAQGQRVLLVEDDEALRRVFRRILVQQGYEVVDTGRPLEAIALVADTSKHFDLLLTDILMPVMDGLEMAEQIGQLRPDLPMLFMSANADARREELITATHEDELLFLAKPFSPDDLCKRLGQIFHRSDFRES